MLKKLIATVFSFSISMQTLQAFNSLAYEAIPIVPLSFPFYQVRAHDVFTCPLLPKVPNNSGLLFSPSLNDLLSCEYVRAYGLCAEDRVPRLLLEPGEICAFRAQANTFWDIVHAVQVHFYNQWNVQGGSLYTKIETALTLYPYSFETMLLGALPAYITKEVFQFILEKKGMTAQEDQGPFTKQVLKIIATYAPSDLYRDPLSFLWVLDRNQETVAHELAILVRQVYPLSYTQSYANGVDFSEVERLVDRTLKTFMDMSHYTILVHSFPESFAGHISQLHLPSVDWDRLWSEKKGVLVGTISRVIQKEIENPEKFYLYHAHHVGITLFHDVITAFYRLKGESGKQISRMYRYYGIDECVPENTRDLLNMVTRSGSLKFQIPEMRELGGLIQASQNNTYETAPDFWNDMSPRFNRFVMSVNLSLFSNYKEPGISSFFYWMSNSSATKIFSTKLLISFFVDLGFGIDESAQLAEKYLKIFKRYGLHRRGLLLQMAIGQSVVDDFLYIAAPFGEPYGTRGTPLIQEWEGEMDSERAATKVQPGYPYLTLETLRLDPLLSRRTPEPSMEGKLFLTPELMSDAAKLESTRYFWPPISDKKLAKYDQEIADQLALDLAMREGR